MTSLSQNPARDTKAAAPLGFLTSAAMSFGFHPAFEKATICPAAKASSRLYLDLRLVLCGASPFLPEDLFTMMLARIGEMWGEPNYSSHAAHVKRTLEARKAVKAMKLRILGKYGLLNNVASCGWIIYHQS